MMVKNFWTFNVFQEDSLYNHFVSVAETCPAPVVVYNMVPVTGIDLSVEILKKMACHPNIVGVKDKDVIIFVFKEYF